MIDSLTIFTLIISFSLTIFCLITSRGNQSKIMLALLFGMITIQAGFKYLTFTTEFLFKNPVYLIFPELSAIVTPAIIYLFVLALLNQRPSRGLLQKMTVLPLFAIVMFFVFYSLTSGFTKDVYYVLENFIILFMVTFTSYLIYSVLSYKKINSSFKNQNLIVSQHIRSVLFWVKLLLALMLFRALVGLLYFSLQLSAPGATWLATATTIHKSVVAITLFIATVLTAYYALRNPNLFKAVSERKAID